MRNSENGKRPPSQQKAILNMSVLYAYGTTKLNLSHVIREICLPGKFWFRGD